MEHVNSTSDIKPLANGLDFNGFRPHLGQRELIDDREAGLFAYLEILRPWRRTVLGVTAAMAAAMLLLTGVFLPRWYRARAVIRSASQEPNTFQQLGISATGFNTLATSIGSVMGLTANDTDSQEFIGVLTSFDFTNAVVRKHGLKQHLLHNRPLASKIKAIWGPLLLHQQRTINPDWELYEVMRRRFQVDFDRRTGNLNLSFIDRNPALACMILNYYLDDLRNKLQARVVKYSRMATEALQQELAATEDPLLRAQLDAVLAVQLQQEKTAEVQADFAFTVIDPPVVPDHFAEPGILLDTLLVSLLTFLVLCGSIICHQRMRLSYARFNLRRTAASIEVTAQPPDTKLHSVASRF